MKQRSILIIWACFGISCSNENPVKHINSESIEKKRLRSESFYDDYGKIKEYNYFDMSGNLQFIMDYSDSISKPMGMPFIQIWNKSHYKLKDTVLLKVHVASPPYIKIKFYIEENKDTILYNESEEYIYKKIVSTNQDSIKLRATFYKGSKKWLTFKRDLPISIKN